MPLIFRSHAIESRRDIIAQSQSGTGKTGAFTIGMLNNLDTTIKKTQYIIITPTHELAKQIYDVIIALTNYMDVSIVKVIGKTNMNDSRNELMKDINDLKVCVDSFIVILLSKKSLNFFGILILLNIS